MKELTSGGFESFEDLSLSAEARAVELLGMADIQKQTEPLTKYEKAGELIYMG